MKKSKWFSKSIIAFFLITIIITLSSITPAFANEKETVRVACGINRSLYLDENGEPQGYCKNYLLELANLNNWNIEYFEGSMNESLQNLYDNKVDIVFPLQKNETREKVMDFSSLSGGYQPLCIYAMDDKNVVYNDYASINGSRIAVTENSSNEAALKEFSKKHNFSYTPVYIDSMKEKSDAVKAGKADYIAASTVYDIDNYLIASVISYEPFYYAVREGNSKLLEELNSGMAHIMAEQPELASNVYLSFIDNGARVAHTTEENEWLNNNGKIVVGVYQDTPPLYHEKDGEKPHGIYVNLIKLLSEKTGADIELYPIDCGTYAYDLLKNGTIDVVLGSNDASLKAMNDEQYVYSAPILDYTTVTISKNNYVKNENGDPVYALTSARKYWESMILENSPNAVIKYYKTSKDCLIAVQNGDADITLLNSWEFNYHSKNARFDDLMEWENHRIYADIVMSTMNTADKNMLSIIDKGIAELTQTETNEIITLNLNSQYDEYSAKDRFYVYKNIIIGSLIVLILLITFFISSAIMRKKYVKKLELSNIELMQANKAKSSFLASMSHDIRTPMNVIIGMTGLAKENNNPSDTTECLDKINVSSQFLLGLVNDILDMERMDSGKFKLNLVPYSGEEFTKYIDAVIKPLCDQKNINFEYTYNGSNDFIIMQDKLRINQIYFNLLSNAAKFTPEGGKVTFNTDITHKDDKVILDVQISDTGIGMSEEFQKRMFEPFVQENQKETPAGTGTGLGLSIVNKLCTMMGMKISVKSKLNIGTTFYLHGEYEKAKETQIQKKVEEKDEGDTQSISLNGKTILVCEDHPLNQEIIRRLLEKENMIVIIKEDGKEGLEEFRHSPPNGLDAILMDIRMPVMDGLEATKEIRSLDRPDAKKIPIIALSANAYDEDVKKCLSVGMNAHFSKPIEPVKLYEILKKFISKE